MTTEHDKKVAESFADWVIENLGLPKEKKSELQLAAEVTLENHRRNVLAQNCDSA